MGKKEFSKSNSLALKGIAIIMMVFHHLFRKKTLYEGYFISFFPFNEQFVLDISTMFKICVSIFAFITGYGLQKSLRNLDKDYNWSNKQTYKWISNRLIKMMSSFWLIALLSYIICQITLL